jgi:pyruvate/2-oxoglutarate dehydrogenase complex dihydrolipoamide acyltransferase (E2) component
MGEPIKVYDAEGNERVVYGHAQALSLTGQGYTYTAPQDVPAGVSVAEDVPADVAEDADAPVVEVPAEAVEVDATDAARDKAKELGVNIAGLKGTGKDGRITVEDVKQASEA